MASAAVDSAIEACRALCDDWGSGGSDGSGVDVGGDDESGDDGVGSEGWCRAQRAGTGGLRLTDTACGRNGRPMVENEEEVNARRLAADAGSSNKDEGIAIVS